MRVSRRIGPHALLIGLFECARGALLFTLLPNHLRFGVGHQMSVVGLALSAYSFTELATKVPSGWVIDRVGRRAPLVGGLGLSILSVLLLAEARQTWAVLAAAALGGLGASPVWPSVVSGLVEATDDGRRGEAVGALLTSWMLGIGIGFVVTNFLLEIHGAVAFGFVLGCLGATFFLVLPATRGFPRPEAAARERPPQQNGTSEVRWLWPLFAGMVLQTVGGGMLLPILSPYAREVLHLTPLRIGALLAAGPGLTVLLLVPLGRVVDHVGRVEVLSISLGAGAAVLFILPYLRSLWALVPMVALLGLAYATLLPAWNTLVMDLLPPHRRATMLGLAMALEGLGVAIGTAVGGILWDAYGPAQPFRVASGVLACVAVGYLLLLPRSLGTPLGHRA
ncbi:MAG: MFS transporter [Armatimonadota bacterium]|nr:MFS transporter [Armatimonadota bacterium]MDR7444708.1 MFS transporter [Armatimonadota bacterium]MDR7571239.1 MFS transporter [Armatimonadota bacterium]MDR7613288.1 MFS transporter [Armatimonadota bacterium]